MDLLAVDHLGAHFELYVDGSFDPASNHGIGAYLFIDRTSDVAKSVVTASFSVASCARLELTTLLWALKQLEAELKACHSNHPLVIYTDSKTVAELDGRRTRLERHSFANKAGVPLSNGDLYQDFFSVCDALREGFRLNVKWIKGHSKKHGQTREQALFAIVDHEARATLRQSRHRKTLPL